MTLWFVTPAWRRYELSAICFDQRRDVMDRLASAGVPTRCVVIADDANLDLARERGFDVVEQDNRWLGRKFNDGIEYARKNGADWIVPIGSDDWIDPNYLVPLPTRPRCSRWYVAVERESIHQFDLPIGPGRMIPVAALPSRPADDRLRRGVDRSIAMHLGQTKWERRDVHPLQYVGFRGARHITTVSKLRGAHGDVELDDPWRRLAEHYPAEFVDRAREAMAEVRPPLSVGRLDAWSLRDRALSMLDRLRRG